MHLDVVDLIEFYAEPLGQVTRRFVRRQIRTCWPDLGGQRLLGFGYATPFLRPFLSEAERVVAAMPATQGVTHWPLGQRGLTALVEDNMLPFADALFDRVLVVHGLEGSDSARGLMAEIWRVLAPEGRVLVVSPNRESLWARSERTPFGQGLPFSKGQLSRLLEHHHFEVCTHARALFLPPYRLRAVLAASQAWEQAGARLWPRFSGVIMIEARKRLHGVTQVRRLKVPVRRALPAALRPATSRRVAKAPGGRRNEPA